MQRKGFHPKAPLPPGREQQEGFTTRNGYVACSDRCSPSEPRASTFGQPHGFLRICTGRPCGPLPCRGVSGAAPLAAHQLSRPDARLHYCVQRVLDQSFGLRGGFLRMQSPRSQLTLQPVKVLAHPILIHSMPTGEVALLDVGHAIAFWSIRHRQVDARQHFHDFPSGWSGTQKSPRCCVPGWPPTP